MKRSFLNITAIVVAIAGFSSVAKGQTMEDVALFSKHNYSLSTARSAAMGGAFVSLGADAVSMSLNPAGMGMYRKSEVVLTPGFRYAGSNTNVGGMNDSRGQISKFVIGNFSAVFAGRNYAIGVGYNRLADFGGRSTSRGAATEQSLGDMFAGQLQGIPSSGLGTVGNDAYYAFGRHNPEYWGAILAYQTYLVEPTTVGGSDYSMSPSLFKGDLVTPMQTIQTSGAIDEIAISWGSNYNDFIYFGASMGLQDINYSKSSSYGELSDQDNQGLLDNFTYRRNQTAQGVGFNLKFGVTVRPLDWLRIGVAYHTPTWSSIHDEMAEDMTVYQFGISKSVFADSPILENDYSMRSPSRLLVGASATIAHSLILSVDYESVWYGDMKFRTDQLRYLNSDIRQTYGVANHVRVGVEYQPMQSLFVRAGYAFSESPYKYHELKSYGSLHQYSVGLGYRTKYFSVDAAYVYGKSKDIPYAYYTNYADNINTSISASNVLVTLGVRF